MFTHHNSVYVFGGMDDERSEHMSMWKWDLSKDEGFEPVSYRCEALFDSLRFPSIADKPPGIPRMQ